MTVTHSCHCEISRGKKKQPRPVMEQFMKKAGLENVQDSPIRPFT